MKEETKGGSVGSCYPRQAGAGQVDQCFCSVAGYEIRVRDHLDTCWWRWFEGWTITNLENGEVLLVRLQVDQSALHGVLNKIRDLNLTLISVAKIELAPVQKDSTG